MDKWKENELNKMKVGGNKVAKQFFESQPDYRPDWSLQEKYNSRAAALLRDKVEFNHFSTSEFIVLLQFIVINLFFIYYLYLTYTLFI